jgi:uncharacterized protein (TIGR02231 family)
MNIRCFFLFIMLFFLASSPAFGAPVRVVLFPNSGQITERISPRPGQDSRMEFSIPGAADPQSLTVQLLAPRATIENISWSRRTRQDPAEVLALLKELDSLKQTRAALEARLEGARTTATFWKTMAQKGIQDPAQAVQLGSTMGQELEKAMVRASGVESELTELNRKISLLQSRVDGIRGRLETMWNVVVDIDGDVSGTPGLECTYVLQECGWQPVYRLNARPEQDLIDFSWTARIHQATGTEWSDVSLALATVRPGTAPMPGPVHPWIIAPRPEPELLRSKAAFSRQMAEVAPAPAPMADTQAPSEKGTYAVWEVGTRNIPAGEPVRVSLLNESWPAGFRYLLRPSRSPLGFLQAQISLEKPRRIPAGTAMFLVDGALLHKRGFSLAGRDAEIFFGNDPLVRVETVLRDKKSGEKGFFAGKQSFAWTWDMTVSNNKEIPVRIRVEEPRPQLRDERIALELKAAPDPEGDQDPALMTWEFELGPKTDRDISVEARVAAPKEMKLDTGRRF